MAFISSNKYPQWQGKVLLGSMKFHHLVLLEIINTEVVKQTILLADVGGRVRNVIQGSDGYIYLGVDGIGILRLLP
jgi:glucose/arabinose dehydrogenase